MITTIVDEKYLYKEARYLLSSIYKHMPKEKVLLFLVNTPKSVLKDVKQWNPNTIIVHKQLKVPSSQYKSYMYVMMTFIFKWIFDDKLTDEDIIYLDADIVLKGSLAELYKQLENYELLFRYQPFNRFRGPTTYNYGGIMNNGCIAMKNSASMHSYANKLKENITNYLQTGKDPVYFSKEAGVITCIDQEMLFTTLLDMRETIEFKALDNKYNDTQFTDSGIVWHAKGSKRTEPEYLIECYRYGNQDINITKEKAKLYYRKIKKTVKFFLAKSPSLKIQNINSKKRYTIINSDIILANKKEFCDSNIHCIDINPPTYYKNKNKLLKLNIPHILIEPDIKDIKYKGTVIIDKNSLSIIKENLESLVVI